MTDGRSASTFTIFPIFELCVAWVPSGDATAAIAIVSPGAATSIAFIIIIGAVAINRY